MPKIVCVTACPTGIAHTYIAAEALKIAGESLGYQMMIETNGAIGIENKLNLTDIAESLGVIIAADVMIDKHRFKNKVIVETSTLEAIKDAKLLIKELLNQIKG